MSYLNSVTIVGFVGADPEQRQARNNGSKFTVLSVATQRSWKNAEDEWVSKVEWHRIAIYMELDSPSRETQRSPCRSEVYCKRGVRRTWAIANPGTTLLPCRRVDILCCSLDSSGPRDFAISIRIPRSHTHPGSSRLRAG